jgi:hypothetical protein
MLSRFDPANGCLPKPCQIRQLLLREPERLPPWDDVAGD